MHRFSYLLFSSFFFFASWVWQRCGGGIPVEFCLHSHSEDTSVSTLHAYGFHTHKHTAFIWSLGGYYCTYCLLKKISSSECLNAVKALVVEEADKPNQVPRARPRCWQARPHTGCSLITYTAGNWDEYVGKKKRDKTELDAEGKIARTSCVSI